MKNMRLILRRPLVKSAVIMLAMLIAYMLFLFRPLSGKTVNGTLASTVLMLALVAVTYAVEAIGLWLGVLERPKWLTLPFLIYTAVLFWDDMKWAVVNCAAAGAVVSACVSVMVADGKHFDRETMEAQEIALSRIVGATLTIILAVVIPLSSIRCYRTNVVEPPQTCTEEQLTDALARLEEFEQLELSDKYCLLEKIMNYDSVQLGLSHKLTLKLEDCEGSIAGYYDSSENSITIDPETLGRAAPKRALVILLHEVYHAYEHELVELYEQLDEQQRQLYVFAPCEEYAYEFQNYVNGEENYFAYARQTVELDANRYAIERAEYYIAWQSN